MRLAATFLYRIDSDEPQHLHVVWGWTQGLLQYRDVFDNHMPLFQMLCAPLLRLIGERPEALIIMRVAMLPLYAATIALTWRIAASCYPRRVALWSTIIAALIPGFVLGSTEFRTDDLWTLFWLLSIAILLRGPVTAARVFAGGLALGFAGAVSAKTSLLLLAIAIGAVALVFRTRKWRAVGLAPLFLAGLAIPPALIALYFYARGAWDPFVYGVVSHNLMHHSRIVRLLLFPVGMAVIGLVGRTIADPRRLFLFVTTHSYAVALYCLWPLGEHEHWLPYYPLAAVTLVPILLTRERRMVAVAAAEIVLVIVFGRLWRNETTEGLSVVEQTLQLTTPEETVMDLKGETVFRRRAFYYALEPLTKHRIRNGQIADTIIPDMLRQHTMVVTGDHYGFPKNTRAFLSRNFVSVGALRVAGKILQPAQTSFQVEVPGEYALLAEEEPFRGSLDGSPYGGPRFLGAGPHGIDSGGIRVALLWSRAAARGLSPFEVVQTSGGFCRNKSQRRHYAHPVRRVLSGFGARDACSRR